MASGKDELDVGEAGRWRLGTRRTAGGGGRGGGGEGKARFRNPAAVLAELPELSEQGYQSRGRARFPEIIYTIPATSVAKAHSVDVHHAPPRPARPAQTYHRTIPPRRSSPRRQPVHAHLGTTMLLDPVADRRRAANMTWNTAEGSYGA